jgi:hypothetical protein
MEELVTNIHLHTTFSDGTGKHADLAQAALKAGIDVLIVTDHNVWVQGLEDYYTEAKKRVLLLVGEEIHDQARQPQKNHLLVYGAEKELATFAADPQKVIDQANRGGGISFLAHPYEDALPAFGEADIGWVDWNVRDYTGIELWNGLSEIKTRIHHPAQAILFAFFPQLMTLGPKKETVDKWDELLSKGRKVVAICGADAHALKIKKGPLNRTLFPYEYHFRAINNHLLVEHALTGDLKKDKQTVITAFSRGNSFIGYDLPEPTRGFRFHAQGKDSLANMGEEIKLGSGVTLQVKIPKKTTCRLLKDGKTVKVWKDHDICTYLADSPGAYRIECGIRYLGKMRSWIISNPIYIRLK